jgi:hypothetical protein
MKKSIILLLTCVFVLPLFAQKLTKEEKEAAAKAEYEAAVQCVENKLFVIVPVTFTVNGVTEDNTDKSNFLSSEGENLFAQGNMVCGNSYTNLLESSEYNLSFDKKGNMKLRIVVTGRMMKGVYTISLKNNTNMADVIFAPPSGTTRRFTGPIQPPKSDFYNKRANPM